MSLSAQDCLARATELEAKAMAHPTNAKVYRSMASKWRELARGAAFLEHPNFGLRSRDFDPRH